MYFEDKILVGSNDATSVYLLPKLANRHGLIAGATGTGKTITLKALAESFSDMGVPVFLADMKGDVSGLAKTGGANDKINQRIEQYDLKSKGYEFKSYPVEFWDLFGEKGLPIRVTISQMGPTLLSKILNLTEAQEAILNVVFKIADNESLLLIDIKDLKSMIKHVTDNRTQYESDYGAISTRSANTIIRSLLTLEEQGANIFFGEPALELDDLITCDDEGRGIINILDAVKLSRSPDLYSTFLLWLLTDLYETLPEVGDLDKAKFVFFFDEAHLLFDNLSPSFNQKIEQVIRLIRSKGVGLYFISQSPSDIPEVILSQLGNRIQHALRAYTPKEQKAVKVASETFRPNPEFKTLDEITNLAIGQALVSMLDNDGVPSIVEKVDIIPLQSDSSPISDEFRNEIMGMSVYKDKYMEAFDRQSAYECLAQRIETANANENVNNNMDFNPDAQKTQSSKTSGTGTPKRQPKSEMEKMASTAMNTVARELTRQITRGLFKQLKF